MTTTDPISRLTSTYNDRDLTAFTADGGRYLSVLLPAPSNRADAAHHLATQWKNTRRQIDDWPADLLDAIDDEIADLDHGAAAAFVILQRADGALLVEHLTIGVEAALAVTGSAPRLIEIIDHRQQTLPHVVVATDRVGADIIGFDGGNVVAESTVDGDTEHIHRGHFGGWSNRRFQQRAENTWESNAGDVAEVVATVADDLGAELIAVAGDVRATQFVIDALPVHLRDRTAELEAGDTDGIAEETLRLVSDHHARLVRSVLDELRSTAGPTTIEEVERALESGQVRALLVTGGDAHTEHSAKSEQLDVAVTKALQTGAPVIIVPSVSDLSDGMGALLRW